MYRFRIPIGDWSDDGHGKVQWFNMESNEPVEYVRKLYFRACKKLGFSLDSYNPKPICSKYEDCSFPKEYLHILLNNGAIFDEKFIKFIESNECIECPEEFLDILIEFIKTQDPDLILKREQTEDFVFYGILGRQHIGHIGYGLFVD